MGMAGSFHPRILWWMEHGLLTTITEAMRNCRQRDHYIVKLMSWYGFVMILSKIQQRTSDRRNETQCFAVYTFKSCQIIQSLHVRSLVIPDLANYPLPKAKGFGLAFFIHPSVHFSVCQSLHPQP